MQTKDAIIRTRIPLPLKEEANAVFEALGLSFGDAIRMFLVQVRQQRGMPFKLSSPSSDDNSDLLVSTSQRQAALDACYDD